MSAFDEKPNLDAADADQGPFGSAPPAGGEHSNYGPTSGTVNAGVSASGTANVAERSWWDKLWGDDKPLAPIVTEALKAADEAIAKAKAEAAAKQAAAEKQAAKEQRDKEVEQDAAKDPLFKKDPKAARELADARRDLKGMVEVVDPSKVPEKDRKQNQVTQKEYDDMVKTYAGVKNGESDLKVEAVKSGNAEKDEEARDKSLRDVARIMQTKSGRGMIGELASNQDEKGRHHVTTIKTSSDESTVPETSPNADQDALKWADPVVNVAGGARVKIPGTSDKVDWANLGRSDVVLYHELVHAYHYAKGDDASFGMKKKNYVSDLDKDGNVAAKEYQAVGLGPWAKGGKYADKGFNKDPRKATKGGPWGDSKYSENNYRDERNNITDGGKYNDAVLSDALKAKYPNWEGQWADGKLEQRERYNPEAPP